MTKEKKEQATARVLRFMLKTAWEKKKSLFAVYMILFAAEWIQKLQLVIFPKFLIDELLFYIQGTRDTEHLKRAVSYAALIVAVGFVTNLVIHAARQYKKVLAEWFDEYFETELADQTMRMDYEHTEDPKALEQLGKAKQGISWYSGGVVGVLDYFYNAIMNATVVVGVGAIIIAVCPGLLLVQLAALAAVAFFNARNNAVEIESFQKLSQTNRVFGYVLYTLAQIKYGKDVRLYDSSEMMCTKASDFLQKQTDVWEENAVKQRANYWCIDVINGIRDGICYFYIGYLALNGSITIGDFTMCAAAAAALYWSLAMIVDAGQEIVKRCNYAVQFLCFLEYPAAMAKGSKKTVGDEHVIEFSHVSFRYPRADKEVLHDINLTIRPGEHLSIVGLNGAGKTTFVKLLCRLYDVTEGEIKIDGVNIKEYSEEEYKKLFAVVFQDFKLFAFSLRENIIFREEGEDEALSRVFELAGLHEDIQKLPQKADTILYKNFDERGIELSGGQQQKMAIGRALYRNAPIVILDEPTAALDPVAEYDIYRRFNSLVGGKTAIYISHRLSSCKFCDRIAVFAGESIKEYGTHEELVNKEGGIYAEMFAAQAQYYQVS